MADLGDISGFLKEGAVNNLDWLDVDDKAYRELSDLPQQNLDFAPDLEAAWSHKGESPSTYLVPNKDVPRTMGDLSEAHGKLASEALAQVEKVTRLAIMQSTDPGRISNALKTRFDSGTLQAARPLIASILQERGLLGRYYIDASDFPNCSKKAGQREADFVKRNAGTARFIVAKDPCLDCTHNAKSTCSVFHKELVLEVPYSSELASAVERSQCACGKQAVQASIQDPRDRIRLAYLAKDVRVTTVETPKPIANPVHQLKATVEPPKVHLPVLASQAEQLLAEQLAWVPPTTGKTASISKDASSKKAFDVCSFLKREMLKGRSEKELLQALKLSFSLDDLRATRSSWEPLYREAGLYGTVYTTQDSFDSCHEGADFIAKHNHQIKGIVASQKCATCIYSKLSRCLVYGKPLVVKAEDLYTDETVKQAIWDHRQAGHLGSGSESYKWGETPDQALKAIYRTASASNPQAHIPMRAYVEQEFRGNNTGYSTSGLTKREVVRTASRFLNEGLYGHQLLNALRTRFDSRDILSSQAELKVAMREQGLQGIYYIDPTIYNDYAKGCDEGARLHRSRQVPYVKLGSKCATCVLQPHPGFCSKYAKHLVVEPPYADKAAQQREMLASGPATEVSLGSLMIHNPSSVADLVQLKSGMEINLNPVQQRSPTVSVELGGAVIDL